MVALNSPVVSDNSLPSYGVARVGLENFRSYRQLNLYCESKGPVVLVGENGAGKTNLLEAISLMAPGRGLRKASLPEMGYSVTSSLGGGVNPSSTWGVRLDLLGLQEETTLKTTCAMEWGSTKRPTRQNIANETALSSQAELTEYANIVWLTPHLDRLFLEGASDRRRYLDQLASGWMGPEYAKLLYRYEHAMGERLRLLRSGRLDPTWLCALEERMAGPAVALTVARLEVITLLNNAFKEDMRFLPTMFVDLEGPLVEALKKGGSALNVEALCREGLTQSRLQDAQEGRTTFGAHRQDLKAFFGEKSIEAAQCSTGQQKIMLLEMTLAFARARASKTQAYSSHQAVPILLLDEVVAHLDASRRQALFEEVLALPFQTWMTGTDLSSFDPLRDGGQVLYVKESEDGTKVEY
jgi:DNA replication and repair protein RecF